MQFGCSACDHMHVLERLYIYIYDYIYIFNPFYFVCALAKVPESCVMQVSP